MLRLRDVASFISQSFHICLNARENKKHRTIENLNNAFRSNPYMSLKNEMLLACIDMLFYGMSWTGIFELLQSMEFLDAPHCCDIIGSMHGTQSAACSSQFNSTLIYPEECSQTQRAAEKNEIHRVRS